MSEETENRSIEEEKEPLITREAIGARFRAVGRALRSIPRPPALHTTILVLVLAMAGIVRLLPLRWGAYISEFDPYFNLNDMRHITANGWVSWYSYTISTSWFPFGRAPVTTSYPGTSFTGTLFYQFLQSIGVNISVYDAAVYVPIVLGMFAVLVTYFFAKDIWGKSAGLFAALFAAFNSSLISRTALGFFRNEGVGIPTMILTFLFFLRAIQPQRSLKSTLVYSMLSSISLIYMAFSWGSFRYAAEVIGLFTLAMILLRRYTPRLFLSYGITVGFFLYTGTSIPDLGHVFLSEGTTLALIGVMALLVVMELAKFTPTTRGRLTVAGLFGAGIAASAYFILTTNFLSLGSKFLTTINPFLRNSIPLVASVAENRPSTWASFFLELDSVLLRRQPGPAYSSSWTSHLDTRRHNRRGTRQTSNGHHTTIGNLLTTQVTLHHTSQQRIQHRNTRHHPLAHHPLVHSRRSVRLLPRHDCLVQPSRPCLHRRLAPNTSMDEQQPTTDLSRLRVVGLRLMDILKHGNA